MIQRSRRDRPRHKKIEGDSVLPRRPHSIESQSFCFPIHPCVGIGSVLPWPHLASCFVKPATGISSEMHFGLTRDAFFVAPCSSFASASSLSDSVLPWSLRTRLQSSLVSPTHWGGSVLPSPSLCLEPRRIPSQFNSVGADSVLSLPASLN